MVWLHTCGSQERESDICDSLRAVGLEVGPLEPESRGPYGIVCYTEANEELLHFLREARRTGDCRVIALSVAETGPDTAAGWRLLNAGACDVIAWETGMPGCGADAAHRLRARFERWREIDRLACDACREYGLVGEGREWRALMRTIVEAARFTETPILLTGESGTGKELVSRLIHRITPNSTGREMVTVDCGAIVPELSGCELFGHERGAFTGALNARDGAFALANGSTLFLDEIGELPLALQPQLLRAVQERSYKRVGGNAWQNTSFRLICATNRDLRELVERGEFRQDLYFRIAGRVFRMPPLRERREDILPLASHFFRCVLGETPEIDPPVREYLMNRTYPGNVRELRQLVQRIAHGHVGPGPITAGDIPEEDRPHDGDEQRAWPDENLHRTIADAVTLGASLRKISQTTTETAIRYAVQSENGNLQRAAKRLGVTDRALQMRRARAAGGQE